MTAPRRTGALADTVAILGAFLLLGMVGAVAWWLVVDPAEFTRTTSGGGAMSELQLSRRFAADGWFAVVAAILGAPAGLMLTWWRSRDLRLTTALLVPGAALAALVMSRVGSLFGPGDPHAAIDEVREGARVPVELVVTAPSTYLVWPIAVLFGALMVLWSTPRHGVAPVVPANSSNPPHSGG